MARISEKHEAIIKLINRGYKNPEICNTLGVKDHTIFYVKRKYKTELKPADSIKNNTDIREFDDNINNILKSNILKIGNEISNRSLSKYSITQLTTAFGTLFDKHRLQVGRSTNNISTQIIEILDDNQLKIIQDSIKSLKESMLLEHKSGKG